MAFSNFPWGSVPTLHISYHLGEHYNSVRLLEDPGDGPAMPIGHELQIKNPLSSHENDKEDSKEVITEEKPTVSFISTNTSIERITHPVCDQHDWHVRV